MRKTVLALLAVIALTSLLFAEGTRTWFQSRYEDFEKGTARGVAVSSDGVIELSPALKQMTSTPSTYLWAVVSDAEGNAYIAAGAPARVYKVTPSGDTSVIFEPQELQVQALLMSRDGSTLYAATSPDGKVYKIVHNGGGAPPQKEAAKSSEATPANQAPEANRNLPVDKSYTASVFYDPKTKYIWNLAEDNDGRLYIATGDHGEIYRVDKTGNNSGVFFKSDEAHIRVMAFDPKGNLIAGSDGSGLIYRIAPNGDAFVLYSAPKKEITALAIDKQGNIYAAGAVEKRAGSTGGFPLPAPQVMGPAPAPTVTIAPGVQTTVVQQPQVNFPPTINFTATGGSEIYRIAPDGSPKRIWQSHDELVYALAFDGRGRLIAGTGNKGRLFVIGDDNFVDLGKVSANQVTGLAPAPNGGMYLATSNLAKLFVVGGTADADGTFESDVFDAKVFSRWGRAAVLGTGAFDLWARSGNVDNPDRNWSEWKKVDLSREEPMEVPPARFVQWRVVLHPGNPAPTVSSVLVNYLPKNVAPEVDDVYVQPGARFMPVPRMSNDNVPVTVGPTGPGGGPIRFESAPNAIRDKDYVAVRWVAQDENDDDLVYSLYYRGDHEARWKLLKDNITDKFYSFESALLPDGGYTMLVVASDAPSHTPEDALSDSKESARFEVDSTPPQVVNLVASIENGAIHITCRAIDGFSPIRRAEYSVDAGDWHVVEPVGQISDYRVENYDFSVALPTEDTTITTGPKSTATVAVTKKPKNTPPPQGEEHVVVLRVYDRFENMGSAKTVIHGQ